MVCHKEESGSGNMLNIRGREKKMVYCCSSCRYVFERDSQPMYCPDCGKEYIRYATKAEIDEYIGYQKEFYPDRWKKMVPVAAAG